MRSVSIIIPTYNERDNIEELIVRLSAALRSAGYEFEIIVVDDSSPDGTAEVAERLSSSYPVRVMRRPAKLGLGSAIMDGVGASRGELIVVMDADLQHPPEAVPELLRSLERCDIAVASRYAPGGGTEGWPMLRKIISRGAIFLAHVLLPSSRGVSDPVSGFFAMRREVVDGLELSPRSFKALLEILQKGKWRSVCEVPYVFRQRRRGESKLNLGEIVRYSKHLLELSRYRPLRFAAVGASGALVNLAILHALISGGADAAIAGPIAIEASVLSNFMLNDRWTFADAREGNFLRRLARYHAAVAAGAAINLATLLTLVKLSVHHIIAGAIGIVAGFAANYLLSSLAVWGRRPASQAE